MSFITRSTFLLWSKKFGHVAHARDVIVRSREQHRSGRRARWSDVETRRAQSASGERIEIRRLDLPSEKAEVRIAQVVGYDQQDVRLLSLGPCRPRLEPRCGNRKYCYAPVCRSKRRGVHRRLRVSYDRVPQNLQLRTEHRSLNVCFWPKADIPFVLTNVRLTQPLAAAAQKCFSSYLLLRIRGLQRMIVMLNELSWTLCSLFGFCRRFRSPFALRRERPL